MKIIVAYDKFKEEDDPFKDVLSVVVEAFRNQNWLRNVEEQFTYVLNTTFEIIVPEGGTERTAVLVAESIATDLALFVHASVICCLSSYGKGNSALDQDAFHEKINFLVMPHG